MDNKRMTEFDLYKDIQNRCKGEIFVGVVGPVRTGKSTFIKRFMDLMVLPNMEESPEKVRLQDELPQSGTGKMITTTEPKFIPKNAANIKLAEDVSVNLRMVDCVGYMVDGASGHMEDDIPRMVKTPWFEEEIPFVKAAEVGTRKVIKEHSTVGVVVTTDGTVTDIPRSSYEAPNKFTDDLTTKVGRMMEGAADITPIALDTFNTVVSAVSFTVDGTTYYAFYSRSIGFHQMDVFFVIDENGAITKMDAKQFIFDEEYFMAFGGMDVTAYKDGFVGITGDTFTGDEVIIATATMTSNAIKESTQDVFTAFNALKGGAQ